MFLDGSTWCARRDTAQRPPHDDWAPVAMAGQDGYPGTARGAFVPSALGGPGPLYRKLDRVSFNGSEWIAMKDDPGPLPGDGWMLGAKVGRQGKPGDPGPKGDRGEAGIGLEAVELDGWSLVLELTGGRRKAIDLRGLFERYDAERGG